MKAKEEEDFVLGRSGNWNGACNTDFLYGFVLKPTASCMKRLGTPFRLLFLEKPNQLLPHAPRSHGLSDKGQFIGSLQMENAGLAPFPAGSRLVLLR